MAVFWEVAPYMSSLIDVGRRFRGTCLLHLPDDGSDKVTTTQGRLRNDCVIFEVGTGIKDTY